jgi:hypothetical protein
MGRHDMSKVNATKHGVPWTLFRSGSFLTRHEAVKRERHYKTERGRDELDWLSRDRRQRDSHP